MSVTPAQHVEMIPIHQITVVNPRMRNRRVFNEIVDNIAELGLKRPITVTRRLEADGPCYDLVCGQGRLEACQALGHSEVPALVVSADEEDCLVASLVENCARRQHRAIDLLQDIGGMKQRGHSISEIARKTGLSYEYVFGVNHLLENGEERLLRAVESGLMPISVAIAIAQAQDHEVQAALQSAYENKLLRGRKLLAARRLVETRRRRGKAMRSTGDRPRRPVSTEALVRAYNEDAEKKRALIKRSEAAKARLTFITEGLRTLIDDDGFFALLEEEGLSTLPENLGARIPDPRVVLA
jgi:ParB family chromosome partitioning protein